MPSVRDGLSPVEVIRGMPAYGLCPLVDTRALANILPIAALLPPVPTHTVCFECRLSAHDSRVDFAFNLLADARALAFARHLEQSEAPSECWLRVVGFIDEWLAAESSLLWQVPFICIAFDMNDISKRLPAPCLSLCVDPSFFASRLGWPAHAPVASMLVDLAENTFRQLTGFAMVGSVGERLRCLLEAHPDVEAKHISFMLPREDVPTKLDVRLPLRAVGDYLHAIRWAGNGRMLERRLRELMPWDGFVQLNLIVDENVGDVLEVESFSNVLDAPDQCRFRLLEHLVSAGAADAAKVRVLRDLWEKPTREHTRGQDLACSWYLKTRLSSCGVVAAKAYVGLMPRIVPPRPIPANGQRGPA